MPPKRCHVCNNFEPRYEMDVILKHFIVFNIEPTGLDDSVKAGCPMCALIRNGIAIFESKVGAFESLRRVEVSMRLPIAGDGHIIALLTCGNGLYTSLDFFVPSKSTPNPSRQYVRLIPGDTASTESFAWAAEQLKSCIDSHTRCNSILPSKLPTRILDVGPTAKLTGLQVKLLEPPATFAQYACLSHCWGNSRSVMTTCQNIDSHRRGIAWQELCKTFQDAITYTRRLGLRYLWIDSLCIIQDDKDDWRKESSEMAAVYQNAYITLAATKSADGNGGLYSDESLRDRDHLVAPRFPFAFPSKWKVKQTNLGQVRVRECIVHIDNEMAIDYHNSHPLMTRGWVYQERLLSPRLLHFCKKELVWECQEKSSCECMDVQDYSRSIPKIGHSSAMVSGTREQRSDIPVADASVRVPSSTVVESSTAQVQSTRSKKMGVFHFISRLLVLKSSKHFSLTADEKNTKSPNDDDASLKQREDDIDAIYQAWHRLVMTYSGYFLSEASDRLPAIAGLAKQIGTCRTGKYMAGLWDDNINGDLLWTAVSTYTQRPANYQAPTWSWASIKGKVDYVYSSGGAENDGFRILEVSCTPVRDRDMFGQIKDGYLVVMGILQPATVTLAVHGSRYLNGEVALSSSTAERIAWRVSPDYNWALEGKGHVQNGAQVYCLGAFETPHEPTMCTLIVRRLENGKEFERIGLAHVTGSNSGAYYDITRNNLIWEYPWQFRKGPIEKIKLV